MERLGFYPNEVVRNGEGRIIATGWPEIAKEIWPSDYVEIEQLVEWQIKFELALRKNYCPNILGAYHTAGGGIFNLGGSLLVPYLRKAVEEKFDGLDRTIEVVDIGGGNGLLLERGTMDWTNPLGRWFADRQRLRTTMTTLVNHDEELLKGRLVVIDDLRLTSIELPPDDFFGRFDVIMAQNSIFYWSQLPELAILNTRKMCKMGAVVLATVQAVPYQVDKGIFDARSYLQTLDYFSYEELAISENSTLVVRMTAI